MKMHKYILKGGKALISANRIDRLAGALASDSQLREAFMVDRLGAIESYNNNYLRRFGAKLIELNEEEEQLILSLRFNHFEEIYGLLDAIIDSQTVLVEQVTLVGIDYSSLSALPGKESSAA